jgi:hypothetical protein
MKKSEGRRCNIPQHRNHVNMWEVFHTTRFLSSIRAIYKKANNNTKETKTSNTTNFYNSGVKYTTNNHQNHKKYATSNWTPLSHTSSHNFNLLCKYLDFSDTKFNATFSGTIFFISSNETRK